MRKPKSAAQQSADISPGDHVTPPCQGNVRGVVCRWLPTKLFGRLWLCTECTKVYETRRMVRLVKDKLRKQRKGVT